MTEALEEMQKLALRCADCQLLDTGIPRVTIMRGDAPTGMKHSIYEPMLCLLLQGAKRAMIGDQVLDYDVGSYFTTSIDVPAVGMVSKASTSHPYLAVSLKFDAAVISDVLLTMDAKPDAGEPSVGFGVGSATPALLDAWLRLMRLVEAPGDIAVMAPLLEREIIFRLLQGPSGGMLRQIATADSRMSRVHLAMTWIREHLAEPFRIESLAGLAGMSPSAFHRHFKAVTAMSPIQYQKSLRLHEARRRLLADPGDTAHIAFSVGYGSVTQFSREYGRQFGVSPAKDAVRLRAGTTADAA
jgi:AraC-like DNA-binding protein